MVMSNMTSPLLEARIRALLDGRITVDDFIAFACTHKLPRELSHLFRNHSSLPDHDTVYRAASRYALAREEEELAAA